VMAYPGGMLGRGDGSGMVCQNCSANAAGSGSTAGAAGPATGGGQATKSTRRFFGS
jgi:hypothetical protein